MTAAEFLIGELLVAGCAYAIGRNHEKKDMITKIEKWGILTDQEDVTGTLIDDLCDENED